MSQPASLRTHVLELTDFIERWLLSAMYLWLAWRNGKDVLLKLANRPEAAEQQGWWSVALIQSVDLLAVQLLIGLLLLRSKPPLEGPRQLKEVVVPLLVSTFFVAYSYQTVLPLLWRQPLASLAVQVPCSMVSLAAGAAGSLLALWGVIALGRSFGIFVAVRKVVTAGPYRYVRHPIYSGYLLIWLGLILANLSIAIVLLVTIHTLLMIWRARLEERRLAEASPEYRAYLQRTGFLFPRLGESEATSR